jgi:hypothetical protein
MARHNLRLLPIVTAGGTLIGVLRDVIGLRWLALPRADVAHG